MKSGWSKDKVGLELPLPMDTAGNKRFHRYVCWKRKFGKRQSADEREHGVVKKHENSWNTQVFGFISSTFKDKFRSQNSVWTSTNQDGSGVATVLVLPSKAGSGQSMGREVCWQSWCDWLASTYENDDNQERLLWSMLSGYLQTPRGQADNENYSA